MSVRVGPRQLLDQACKGKGECTGSTSPVGNRIRFSLPSLLSPALAPLVLLLACPPPTMAQYDLTSKLGQFFDLHLVFPLLEFLSSKEVSGPPSLACALPLTYAGRSMITGSCWKAS